jgi:hypothetical protein
VEITFRFIDGRHCERWVCDARLADLDQPAPSLISLT